MTAFVSWQDILLRISAAVLAGAIIGFDRGTRGRIAGLRTTILMCLAAAGAMIEANLTLSVVGKTAQSFSVMDSLRFPLGILSGIGFIGAGAIVRRGNLVIGVTTAATMWLITVVGLIFGAGYFLLGSVVTAITYVVLSFLKAIESRLKREHRANLTVGLGAIGPSNADLREAIESAGFKPIVFGVEYDEQRTVRCTITWYSATAPVEPPPLIDSLSKREGVNYVRWDPVEAGHLAD